MIQQALNQMLATSALGIGLYQQTPQGKAGVLTEQAKKLPRNKDVDTEERRTKKLQEAAELNPTKKRLERLNEAEQGLALEKRKAEAIEKEKQAKEKAEQAKAEKEEKVAELTEEAEVSLELAARGSEEEYENYRDKIIEIAKLNPTGENLQAAEDVYDERKEEEQWEKERPKKEAEKSRKAAEEAAALKRQQEIQQLFSTGKEMYLGRREILKEREELKRG
jgi:hypothetical protein